MIGVDFGASYTDVVLFKNSRLKTYTIPSDSFTFQRLETLLKKGHEVAFTGGIAVVEKKNEGIRQLERNMNVLRVPEIEAIGEGARYLTKMNRMLVVNIGTGTPLVLVEGKNVKHVVGTGIGGGTLAGLGKLLLDVPVEEIERLASKGKPTLDLTVGEAAGGSVGIVPPDATASNFAQATKTKRARKEDVAYSLLNLVSESVGTLAAIAAKKEHVNDIVFTGRVVARNKRVRERLQAVMELFGGKMRVPINAEHATAIGALMIGRKA
ncbi:hypothetical protein KJ765_02260 [Candidatus Micrarchaeota archaeon]|nr:hypothetical protein [Candidatus Micrarchaeota archaeon]